MVILIKVMNRPQMKEGNINFKKTVNDRDQVSGHPSNPTALFPRRDNIVDLQT